MKFKLKAICLYNLVHFSSADETYTKLVLCLFIFLLSILLLKQKRTEEFREIIQIDSLQEPQY